MKGLRGRSECGSVAERRARRRCHRRAASRIYVVTVDGTRLATLGARSGVNLDPACSPDGRYIIFSSKRNDGTDLYVMSAGGGNETRIATFAGHDDAPDRRAEP